MSTSYNSGVILGVTASNLGLKIEEISTPYEVHDKKGKPTGKFENEINFKISFQGKEIIEDDLYPDSIEELIGVKHPLKFLNENYEDIDADTIIIGVELVNNGYNENKVEEIELEDDFDMVKNEIKKQFGADVEPKLYYYFNIS